MATLSFAVKGGRVYVDLARQFDGDGWVWVADRYPLPLMLSGDYDRCPSGVADSPDEAILAATLACWPYMVVAGVHYTAPAAHWPWVPILDRG